MEGLNVKGLDKGVKLTLSSEERGGNVGLWGKERK
jgi:hypothetical protein